MQQTETYKLNLIETSDVFSPNPLNENMEKLEAAIAAEAAALDARVTMLEGSHMVAGSYAGTGTAFGHDQTIELGFTPKLVLIKRTGGSVSGSQTTVVTDVIVSDAHGDLLKIVPGGFWVSKTINSSFNDKGTTYYYFAIG